MDDSSENDVSRITQSGSVSNNNNHDGDSSQAMNTIDSMDTNKPADRNRMYMKGPDSSPSSLDSMHNNFNHSYGEAIHQSHPNQDINTSYSNGDHRATGSSDRKRNRRALQDDSSMQSILGQITSKLNLLSTNPENSHEDSVQVLTDVLQCTKDIATFYLESADWNIEIAVSLFLENSNLSQYGGVLGQSFSHSNNSSNGYNNSVLTGSFPPLNPYRNTSTSDHKHQPFGKKYESKTVSIAGLTEDWIAQINAYSGYVEFVHVPTNIIQNEVPPGFADLDTNSNTKSNSAIDLVPQSVNDHQIHTSGTSTRNQKVGFLDPVDFSASYRNDNMYFTETGVTTASAHLNHLNNSNSSNIDNSNSNNDKDTEMKDL